MVESVYKVVELVGTSSDSWEKAASAAIARAASSLRDLRIAEVVELDMQIKEGKVEAYRAKLKVSFKYEGDCGGGPSSWLRNMVSRAGQGAAARHFTISASYSSPLRRAASSLSPVTKSAPTAPLFMRQFSAARPFFWFPICA
jgi:flavin-binding protein dodecin